MYKNVLILMCFTIVTTRNVPNYNQEEQTAISAVVYPSFGLRTDRRRPLQSKELHVSRLESDQDNHNHRTLNSQFQEKLTEETDNGQDIRETRQSSLGYPRLQDQYDINKAFTNQNSPSNSRKQHRRRISTELNNRNNADSTEEYKKNYTNINENIKPTQYNNKTIVSPKRTRYNETLDNRNNKTNLKVKYNVENKNLSTSTNNTKEIRRTQDRKAQSGDVWVWDSSTKRPIVPKVPIEPSVPVVHKVPVGNTTGNPLVDDRAAFEASKCPTGTVRFNGKCVPEAKR